LRDGDIKEEYKDFEEGQSPGLIRYRSKLDIGDIVTFDKESEPFPDIVKHPYNNYSVLQIEGKYPNTILLLRGEDGESEGELLDKIERKKLVLVKKFEPSYLVVGSKLRYKESYVYAVEIGENGKEEAEKLKGVFTVIDIKPDLEVEGEKQYIIEGEDKEVKIIRDADLDIKVEEIKEESPMVVLPSQQAVSISPEVGQEASPLQIYDNPGMTPPMDSNSPPFVVGDIKTPEEIQDITSQLQYNSPNITLTPPIVLGDRNNVELEEEELVEEGEKEEEEKVKTYTIKEEPDTSGLSMLLPSKEEEDDNEEGDDEGEIKKI